MTPERKKAPLAKGAFLHSRLMHYRSGPPMQFCSGVDTLYAYNHSLIGDRKFPVLRVGNFERNALMLL